MTRDEVLALIEAEALRIETDGGWDAPDWAKSQRADGVAHEASVRLLMRAFEALSEQERVSRSLWERFMPPLKLGEQQCSCSPNVLDAQCRLHGSAVQALLSPKRVSVVEEPEAGAMLSDMRARFEAALVGAQYPGPAIKQIVDVALREAVLHEQFVVPPEDFPAPVALPSVDAPSIVEAHAAQEVRRLRGALEGIAKFPDDAGTQPSLEAGLARDTLEEHREAGGYDAW